MAITKRYFTGPCNGPLTFVRRSFEQRRDAITRGRRGNSDAPEVGGEPVKVGEVHRPVVVEVALTPAAIRLTEVRGESVEVAEVDRSVQVRVTDERVRQQ